MKKKQKLFHTMNDSFILFIGNNKRFCLYRSFNEMINKNMSIIYINYLHN